MNPRNSVNGSRPPDLPPKENAGMLEWACFQQFKQAEQTPLQYQAQNKTHGMLMVLQCTDDLLPQPPPPPPPPSPPVPPPQNSQCPPPLLAGWYPRPRRPNIGGGGAIPVREGEGNAPAVTPLGRSAGQGSILPAKSAAHAPHWSHEKRAQPLESTDAPSSLGHRRPASPTEATVQ